MAKEDKSVRLLVQNIDKRTSDLAPVLDNLSDSLNKITKAFSPRKEENDSPKKDKRAALLEKFAPKIDPTEQLIEETDQNELVLREIKEAIEKNHKESFKVFQNMENFLKVIAVEGAAGGGGVGGLLEGLDILDIGGKDKGGKSGKSPAGAAKAGGGFLKTAAKFASKAALPLAAGMAAFDAIGGYQKAGENLGIEGREATFGEKLSSGAGSAISGLTFGLLDEKAASKGIASFFGAGIPKTPEEAANQSEMLDLAAQAEGGIPTKTKEEIKAVAPEKVKQLIEPTQIVPTAAPTVTPPAAPVAPVAPTVTPPAAPVAPVAPKVEAKPKPVTPVATVATPSAPPVSPAAPKVEAKPKTAPSKPASVSSKSVKENIQGGENLQKLEEKQGELQSLISEYKDEKQKVSTKLANDPKYAEGFVDDPADPEYPKELKAVDEKYKPKIEALKKEVGALSKAPGVEAAKKAQDAEDVEKEDEDDDKELTVKPVEKPMGGKITETTIESTTGGGETTRKANEGLMKKESALVALESEKETKQKELLNKLKAEGKVTTKGMAAIKEFKATDEYKQLEAEYEQKRADVEKSGGPTSEAVTPSTQSSATVSNLSQEVAPSKSTLSAVEKTTPVAPKVEPKPTPTTPVATKKENLEVKKLQEEYFSLGKDLKKLNEDFTIPKEEKKKKRNDIISKATLITEKLEKIEPGSGDLGGLGAFEDREQFKATVEAHKQEDLKAEAMLASGDYEKNDEGAVVKKSSAKPTTPLLPKESITTTTTVKQSITSGETKSAGASAAQEKILGLDDEYNKKTAEVRAKLVKEGKIEEGEIITEDMYQSIPELKALREEKVAKKSELEKEVLAGTSQSITPSTSVSSQTVSNLTNENKDLMENLHNKAVQPVIITNNNSTNSNQQTVSPIRTSPRPSNNSFERKQNQVSSY